MLLKILKNQNAFAVFKNSENSFETQKERSIQKENFNVKLPKLSKNVLMRIMNGLVFGILSKLLYIKMNH